MVIVDVQRAGPSTGMPTKTEQGDLMLAMYGRHGESPLPIVAAYTPGQCFDAAIEAVRIAVKYRTPVILLTDTFLANSSEPWRLPDVTTLPTDRPGLRHRAERPRRQLPPVRPRREPRAPVGDPGHARACATASAGWRRRTARGNISYDPTNHALMTRLRAEKVAKVADEIPPLDVDHEDGAEVLVLGWGSSYGTIRAAVRRVRLKGKKVASAHMFHLNPMPSNTGEVLRSYRKVVIPEMNMGQLVKIIRAEFLVDADSVTKAEGVPFFAEELEAELLERIG